MYHQRTDDKFYCFYVNHCLMDVFSGIMSWFSESYYNAFKHKILGGYDKAIQEIRMHLNKKDQAEILPLPSISLNPFGDITVDPKFAQLWRVPSIGTNLASLYMDPIYEDEYFGFSVIANRFVGNFEVIIYCASAYEYLDFFVQTSMWFHGGFNRRVRPGLIHTNCIIPDDVILGSYGDAPYDWSETGITKQFIKSMNGDYFLYPITLGPQIWLTSATNGSTVYGEDDLASYKLQLSIEYDVDLPTHIIVRSNDRIKDMNIRLSTSDVVYVPLTEVIENETNTIVDNNPFMKDRPKNALGDPLYFKSIKQEEYQQYMNCPTDIIKPCGKAVEDGMNCETITYHHKCTLRYKFTEDIKSTDNFIIDISTIVKYQIHFYDEIIIGDPNIGKLTYGVDYIMDLDETGTKITVLKNVTKDTTWDIYIYQPEGVEDNETDAS